jgi:hypothetical protein
MNRAALGLKTFLFPLVIPLAFSARAGEKQVLRNHLPAALARLQPVDRLPNNDHLELAIGLPLRNREGLATLLKTLYDPTSTNYHRYVTPQQFTETFGPAEQDYQAAINFAKANGLTIKSTTPNRMLLNVGGSVAVVEKTFNVKVRVYQHPTEPRTFYAPDVEPSLDLDVPVLHISGLDNFVTPHPRNLRAATLRDPANAVPHTGSGPGGSFRGNDFRAAYVPATSLTGAGQAVGLFELDGYYASDITTFETQAGLPNVPLKNVLVDGFSGTPTSRRPGSGNEEVALDIEMAISMAPGLSQVIVYEGSPAATAATIDDIFNRMATDNLAKQISCSWGFDIDVTTRQIFQQFAAQGQSFFMASGDSGAFAGPIEQPSDDPYLTIVGGTTLTTSTSHSWVSETAWDGSGGGISTLYPIPSWQQGIDMSANQGSATMRNLPDVAMVADNVWIVADRGRSFAVVGTSIAAPLWAGFIALVNQQAAASGQPPVGFLNPAIYTIGKGLGYTSNFHDITTGNTTNSSSPDLFFAVSGYDLCTGWGTPTGTNLINALLAPLPEALLITPPLGFIAYGPPGGPFSVASQNYSLTNTGTAPLNWTLVNTSAWLDVSPSNGTLMPGGPAATVRVALNAAASHLLIGADTAQISFTNLNDAVGQNRQFDLLVGNGGFETGDFTGWTLSGDTNVNFADSIDLSIGSGGQTIPGIDDEQFVYSGIYGAFLGQPDSLGHLSRALPTLPGQRYLLSFWLDNPTNGTPNEFIATWNGNKLFDGVDMEEFVWTNLQFVVMATGPSTDLQFGFRNDQNAFGLDDISVRPIPIAAPIFQNVTLTTGLIQLTWSAPPGLTYQMQYATDLNPIAWNNLGNPITPTNGTVTASDTITGSLQRFYRIVVLP